MPVRAIDPLQRDPHPPVAFGVESEPIRDSKNHGRPQLHSILRRVPHQRRRRVNRLKRIHPLPALPHHAARQRVSVIAKLILL